MNKLTLAATLALAMGGYAMAQCGEPQAAPVAKCALFYDVTLNLKTTIAKQGSAWVQKDLCGEDTEYDAECYRVKGSRTIKGFIYSCDCWCIPEKQYVDVIDEQTGATNKVWNGAYVPGSFETNMGPFDGDTGWMIFLWENKTRIQYALGDEFQWDAFWRIGKKGRDLETAWYSVSEGYNPYGEGKFEAFSTFVGMGFSSVDKKGVVKSMKGNVVGWLSPPAFIHNKKECCPAFPFEFCNGEELFVDTIAFGSWKMKLNTKAAARIKVNVYDVPLPGWWVTPL